MTVATFVEPIGLAPREGAGMSKLKPMRFTWMNFSSKKPSSAKRSSSINLIGGFFFVCIQAFSPILGAQQTGQQAAANTAHGAKLIPQPAPPTTQEVDLFSFRDPNTDVLVKVKYQPATPEQLRKYAPSKVRTMMAGFPAKPGIKGVAKEFAVDFPAEFIAFTGAMLISSSLHTNNDPASMKHFIDQNILDPAAYASFAGFLAGSRASHAFFKATGHAYDPYRSDFRYTTGVLADSDLDDPKNPGRKLKIPAPLNGANSVLVGDVETRANLSNLRSVAVPGPLNRKQTLFAPLMGPMGLAVGMGFSSVIHELLADQDIRACSKARSTPSLPTAAADEICDKAWENWALSKKAADYTPDMLALGTTAIIHTYAVNKALPWAVSAVAVKTGAERYIPVVFKGFRVVKTFGANHPAGRFAMMIGNITVFMAIAEPLTPWFKKPFESVRQGAALAKQIRDIRLELGRAEKNAWVWEPVKYDQPTYCMGDPMSHGLSGSMMELELGCTLPEQPTPGYLLKKHAERQSKWRGFILQEAFANHSNWQDYVSRFAVMYLNATRYYEQLIKHVNFQRFDKRAKDNPTILYREMPLYGISSDGKDFSGESKRKAVAAAKDWLDSYFKTAEQKKRRLHSSERSSLPIIHAGLLAFDPTSDIKALAPMELGFRNLDGMTEEQRLNIEMRVRERMLEKAIKTLKEVLANDPFYNDRHLQFLSGDQVSDYYKKIAEGNPFMKVRILLGNPEPMGPGLAFIRGANDDENVIEQETKTNHPDGISRAATNSMSEYMLASMVCGPELDPQISNSEKIKIYYNKMKDSKFESALRELGLGGRPRDASDPGVLIAVREHLDEITGKQSRVIPRWKKNASITDWSGFRLDFRPPRIVSGLPEDFCNLFPLNANSDKIMFNIHEAQWKIGAETFNGMLDIVRRKARVEIVGRSAPPEDKTVEWENSFNNWWTEKVDRHIEKTVADLRSRYKEIVRDVYLPALLGQQEGWLASYLRTLNTPLSFVGWGVKLGALDSLNSELDFYLDVLRKTTRNTPGFDGAAANLRAEIKGMGELVSDLDFVDRKGPEAKSAIEARREALDTRFKELITVIDGFDKTAKPSTEIKQVQLQSVKNIQGLIGELDSYWGIIRGIQVLGQ